MTTQSVIDSFNDFFARVASDTDKKERLFIAAGLIELLRRAKTQNNVKAMVALLKNLPAVTWQNIDFSFTHALLGSECKNRVLHAGVDEQDLNEVLLRSFLYFIDAAESADEKMSVELFLDLVESVAVDYLAEKKQPQKQKHTPELFNPALPARYFESTETFAEVFKEFRADVVYFRGELPGARLGPDTRGIAFEGHDLSSHIILENGEYVVAKKGASNVAPVNDPDEFRNLPDALLMAVTLASVNLFMCGVIDKTQESCLNIGVFGKIVNGPHHSVSVSFADLQPLEHVFAQARGGGVGVCGATGPVGASIRFPVPDTDLVVVIDARTDAHGAYSVSRLVQVNELDEDTVIMRHDTPRLMTTRGVYIFPTKDFGLVSLTAIF